MDYNQRFHCTPPPQCMPVCQYPGARFVRMQHGGHVDPAALMAKLKKAKAKFYGADWCGYCKKQMAEHEGLKQFYKECGKGGCKTSSGEEITGFPTWEINGQAISGYKTLAQLDAMC